MEPRRLIDVNDLWRYTVTIHGDRYVPWVKLPEVPAAEVRCPRCGAKMDGGDTDGEET